MTTTYTDAQIKSLADSLHYCRDATLNDDAEDMLRSLLSERQATMQGRGGEAKPQRVGLQQVSAIPANYDWADASEHGRFDDAVKFLAGFGLVVAQPSPVVAPQGVVDSANEWMATHAANARKAMLIAAEHAEVLYPGIDDRAWWHHEINALDKAMKAAIAQEKV